MSIQHIDPDATRRALAKLWRKQSHGRGATPRAVVLGMYSEYLRTGSIARAAAAFGRTEVPLRRMFARVGLKATKGPGGANHRLPDAVVASWYAMYRDLGTLDAVAARVGRSPRTIASVLKRHGWPVAPRGGWVRDTLKSEARAA